MINHDLLTRYSDYQAALDTLCRDYTTVEERRVALETRDSFEAEIRCGLLDPIFFGNTIPLSEYAIRATGDMLRRHVRADAAAKAGR